MKLSISYNFAFLCNPKCGSSSVEKALNPFCRTSLAGHPTLKHINAKTYHNHLKPILRKAGVDTKIETFCIMREPVDRIYSWYRYQMRPQLKDPKHEAHAKYTGGMSFEEFVLGFISDKRPVSSAKIGSQANFITLANGSIGIDRIFRLSNMAAVESYLSAKIGKPIVIPHRNASPDNRSKSAKSHDNMGGILSRFGSKSPQPVTPPKNNSTSKPVSKTSPMEISDTLLARLKEYLADEYRIYDEYSVE